MIINIIKPKNLAIFRKGHKKDEKQKSMSIFILSRLTKELETGKGYQTWLPETIENIYVENLQTLPIEQ